MSSELNLDADFTLNELNLDADFVPNHQPDIEAEFNIKVIPDISNLVTKNELQDAVTELDGKISDDHTDITNHIADKTNPHEVTKTQIGLGNVDNTSDLNKPISTATQTALNGKQNTISDLSTIRSNATNGQSAYTTMGGYGDIVTYNASNFATSAQGDLADTALQQGDNISLLNNNAGYITGITSSDVTTALGYTPYNSSNPDGYTSNIGTVTSVNGNLPDENGNVTIQGGGGGVTVDNFLSLTSENPVQNKVITQTLADFSSSIYIDSYLDSIISGNYSELPIVMQSSYNNDLDSIIGGTYVNV